VCVYIYAILYISLCILPHAACATLHLGPKLALPRILGRVEYGERVWTKQGCERGKWGGDRGRGAGGGQVLPLELQNVIRVAK